MGGSRQAFVTIVYGGSVENLPLRMVSLTRSVSVSLLCVCVCVCVFACVCACASSDPVTHD